METPPVPKICGDNCLTKSYNMTVERKELPPVQDGYVRGPIQKFVNSEGERVDAPVVEEASDGRTYIKVLLHREVPEGVIDCTDGKVHAIFRPKDFLEARKIGEVVEVEDY